MAESKTYVVLDSNVLVGDWMLESTAARVVLSEAEAGNIQLLVPEVVLREIQRQYQRGLKGAHREMIKARAARLGYAVGAPDKALSEVQLKVDFASATEQYMTALRRRLQAASVKILPLSSVPHGDLLERALRGRRPFDQDGHVGYRDALIWQNVLELAAYTSRLVLVSSDRDFATKEGALDPSLEDEILSLVPQGQLSATLCVGLHELIAGALSSESALLYEFNERLKRDRNFFERVRDQLDNAWVGSAPLLDVSADIELEWTDLDLDLVNEVFDDFRAVLASEEGGKISVELRAHADIQMRYEVPISEAVSPEGILREGVELWGSRFGEFIDVIPATLSFEATLSSASEELESIHLIGVTEDWDWVQPNRVLGLGPERNRQASREN